MESNEKNELVNEIVGLFKNRIMMIILYGSVARGTNTSESDVDIAIILSDTISSAEKDKLLDIVVDLDLKYNKVYSVVDIKKDDFDEWSTYIPFYKNVKKEGIVLWTAA